MSFPGAILMGAQSRLLPMSVPYRFFLAATVFQVVAWVLVVLAADFVPYYLGGPGPVLAALHATTLGVLVMTAMGASFQMLPVATGRALPAIWPCRLAWWLYLPGVPVLLFGFHGGDPLFMEIGGTLVVAALLVFVYLMADVLRRTRGVLFLMVSYGWAALAGLLGLAALGLLAIGDMHAGFLADRGAVGLAHMVLAVFGFMGMLALGYSQILVPMFALSPAPDETRGAAGFGFAVLGLLMGVVGALFRDGALQVMAVLAGLAASALYLQLMVTALKTGMRKNLGLSFVLVKASWVLLPLTLLVGGAAALGWGGGRTALLFGFLAVFGWLLTLLLGILQRIIPFLAAMNAHKGAKQPRLSELAEETPLKINAACHAAAVLLVAAGILAGMPLLITIGGGLGALGAVAFLWFALDVLRRFRRANPPASTEESPENKTEETSHVSAQPAHPSDPA